VSQRRVLKSKSDGRRRRSEKRRRREKKKKEKNRVFDIREKILLSPLHLKFGS